LAILHLWNYLLNPTASKSTASSRLARGYLICVVAAAFWSATAVFIRYLTNTYHLPPLVLAFWRDLILPLSLGLVFMLANPARLVVDRRHLPFLIAYGLLLSVFNGLWTISVVLNGAAVSTVLAYSSAGFTAILGWQLLHEDLGPIKIVAVLLSLMGCVFVSGAYDLSLWKVNPMGILTGLISGLAYSGYNILGKVAARRMINPWTTLFYIFGFAAFFLFIYNFIPWNLPQQIASPNLFWLGTALAGWGVLALLAIGPTVGGYGLFLVSLTLLPASVAGLITTLEPAMTAMLAYLFLGEVLTPLQWIGSALIVSGVALIRVSESKAGS
jgi:drug/metabolite transporter (DMT)-like permease